MSFWSKLVNRRHKPAAEASAGDKTKAGAVEQGIARESERIARQWKRIIVPAYDRPFSLRSLDIGFRLARETGAAVSLAYIIEVPRALVIDAEMQEEEHAAQIALEDAQTAGRPYRIQINAFVQRTRNVQDGILHLIDREKADLLILGARADEERGLPLELARELFRRASCEVVVDYIAENKPILS